MRLRRCLSVRWWMNLYPLGEVELSRRYLKSIFRGDAEPCLLGGWAVYYTVNEEYRAATGRDYIGSRDIDVGFHVESRWSRDDLESSAFSLFLRRMEDLGFQSQSFRLFRDFDESLEPLGSEEANRKAAFEIVTLYLDPIVDNIHPLMSEVFGFTPVDEPLLETAFRDELFNVQSIGGLKVRVLNPQSLLATKLNSVTTRTQDHKKVKDLADIYSLAWHSGTSLMEMKAYLERLIPNIKQHPLLRGVKENEYWEVSRVLGVEQSEIRRVFRELIR